jgi:type I restriction enzyme S subunit
MDFSKRDGFKETEIGMIPEDWEVTKLENLVLDKIGGEWGTENKESPEEIGCYVLRGTDFSKAAVGKFDNVPFRYVKNKIYEKKKLEEGEVLVELSGGSKDQPTGRIFLITYDLMKDKSKTILFSNFVKKLKLKKLQFILNISIDIGNFCITKGRLQFMKKGLQA